VAGAVLYGTQLKLMRRDMRPVYERLGILPRRDDAVAETMSMSGK